MKLSDLADAPLTYPDVGATAATMPPGYRQVRASRRIGTGRARFEQAAEAVMRYGMLRGAGLTVSATTEVAAPGADVLGRPGPSTPGHGDVDVSPVLDSESYASGGGGGMRSDRRGRRTWSFAACSTSTAILVAISLA